MLQVFPHRGAKRTADERIVGRRLRERFQPRVVRAALNEGATHFLQCLRRETRNRDVFAEVEQLKVLQETNVVTTRGLVQYMLSIYIISKRFTRNIYYCGKWKIHFALAVDDKTNHGCLLVYFRSLLDMITCCVYTCRVLSLFFAIPHINFTFQTAAACNNCNH